MSNPNNDKKSDDITEEIETVQSYIGKFFLYLQKETGFTKRAFTELGLHDYLKKISRNCFQLKIVDDLLATVFKLALTFSKSVGGDLEAAVEKFVMFLYNITSYLVKSFLGRGLLVITSTMSAGMTAFLIVLFHAVMFVYNHFSLRCFAMLKDWIVTLCRSENVRCFFEEIFPTYGRALL